jgi:putative transposase
MQKTRHTTDQIIEKLRQADVALGKGQKVPEVCKSLEITEQTYCRWRQKYGGMAPEMTRQLRALEKERRSWWPSRLSTWRFSRRPPRETGEPRAAEMHGCRSASSLRA